MITLLLRIILCMGILFSTIEAHAEKPVDKKILQVGVLMIPPFALYDSENTINGIAVDIFKEIARRNQWSYKLIPVNTSVDKSIDELTTGKYDILIGPVSVTKDRIQKVSFSKPFFLGETKVAINRQSVSPLKAVLDLLEAIPLGLVLNIFLLLLVVAHIIWLSERRKNKEMPTHYIHGIIFSSWLFVTHFFKGGLLYRPKSVVARFILMFWLIIALSVFLVATSTYTAYITAKVVDSRDSIESSRELKGQRIAYVEGQNYSGFPAHVGAVGIKTRDLKEALMMVQDKEVFAAIGGQLILESELKEIYAPDVVISSVRLKFDAFTFAFPLKSPYLRPTNITLVEMQDSEEVSSICKVYIAEKYVNCLF